jgi:molecular chaperone GrpE
MTDERPRTRAEERIAELDTSPEAMTSRAAAAASEQPTSADYEALRNQLMAAEQEAAENKAGWQRTAADFQNYKRRTEQDREQMFGLANDALLAKLLTIADDFDRAIEHMPADMADVGWVGGITAIDRKLRLLLDSEGLTPIEAVGKPFDPHQHEAVTQETTTAVPDGTVTQELQRGYRIRDRVLRPAMVAVAVNPSNEGAARGANSAGDGESGGLN